MFFLLKQIVLVRVPIYAVPDDKNQPKFRTGSTWVLGMIETVPLTVRQPYIVRVAHDHCVSAIPEELAQAHDTDPTRAIEHLKMYSWPSEFQARKDAAACARRLAPPSPADAPQSPQPCPAAANANQPSLPNQRAAVIPPGERVMLQPEPPRPKRRRGKRRARRRTTPLSETTSAPPSGPATTKKSPSGRSPASSTAPSPQSAGSSTTTRSGSTSSAPSSAPSGPSVSPPSSRGPTRSPTR